MLSTFPRVATAFKTPEGVQSLRGDEVEVTGEDRATQGIEGTLAQRIIYQELQKRQLRFEYLVEEPKGPTLSFVLRQMAIQVPETEAVTSLHGYNDIMAYLYTAKQGLQYAEIAPWEAEGDAIYLESRLDELVGKR